MNVKKKICMLGSFGVGKTSLVSQFIHSVFCEKYLTTIGVKIDRKVVPVTNGELDLVLWDLAGEDRFEHVQASYLAGASGFLLVIDGCRYESLTVAEQILQTHAEAIAELPFICVINKSDLRADWEITIADIEHLERRGWQIALTSAKDNELVESVFQQLANRIFQPAKPRPLAAIF